VSSYLLAIDQGTTSTRAIIFNCQGKVVASSQQEFAQIYPKDGWVEHDPEIIWQTVEETCQTALKKARLSATDIASIGVTNQRETTLVWEKASGKCIYNAIVWQDRRTSEQCRRMKAIDGLVDNIADRTGLLLDPYFSASKLEWILGHVPGAQDKAEQGELLFGTIDSFLLWRLTGGKRHLTDSSNASRTLLFNIHTNCWDDELLAMFNIPRAMLPEIRDCADDFGASYPGFLGTEIPIGGVAGDQQAAMVGQGCFQPGMLKSTYGTGCFMMLNTGQEALASKNRLLTTVAYRIKGQTTYALEGSIFMAGATIQWIRDGLALIKSAEESQALAEKTGTNNPVYMVPAFTGLGAPHWNPDARGAILGLTRDSGIKEIVTAALQSVCYQSKDLIDAMIQDGACPRSIRIDGGMVANNWLVQFLADILGVMVERPQNVETTALGAAMLAGLQSGLFKDMEQLTELVNTECYFEPEMTESKRNRLYDGWLDAVRKISAHDN